MRIETDRLVLRLWRDEDLEPFAQMSADPEVMRWLGGVLTLDQVQAYKVRADTSFAELGMCRMVIERRADGAFVGSCGLMPGHESVPFVPSTDVGWRLARSAWGQGYASEALAALVDVVFALTFAPRIHARAATSDVALAQVLAKQGFLDAGEETIDAPPRGGALRCRRFGLERTTREGLRLRRVPAMSQQSLTQRSVDAPAALRAHAAAPEPGAARGWM